MGAECSERFALTIRPKRGVVPFRPFLHELTQILVHKLRQHNLQADELIALAGDEIIADPSSIVGSIGVVSSSFGFVDLLKKIGVERRTQTAGDRKDQLDPFAPERGSDVIEHDRGQTGGIAIAHRPACAASQKAGVWRDQWIRQ